MNDLATREQQHPAVQFDRQQMDLLRDVVAPGLSDNELVLFSQVCQRTGLDPFARQIFALPRNKKTKGPDGKWRTESVMSIQTSIDGLRLIAQRSGRYAGQTAPEWCGPDGQWVDVWLQPEPPAAARVGVYAKGFAEPLVRVALWAEYAATYDGKPTGTWAKMPALMLAKTAEAQALRAAFPAEMSNVYTEDEMAQADVPEPVERKAAPALPAAAPASGRLSWDEMMEALRGNDPATNWPALVAAAVSAMYGQPPLSAEHKTDLRKRIEALLGTMDGLTMGADFPPPSPEDIAKAVASAFDGLALDVTPFLLQPEVEVEVKPEEPVEATAAEPEQTTIDADDVPFGADENKEGEA